MRAHKCGTTFINYIPLLSLAIREQFQFLEEKYTFNVLIFK